jgi:hypothetical protein
MKKGKKIIFSDRVTRVFFIYFLLCFACLSKANPAPLPLHVNGPAIINSNGCTVKLRGVNIPGMQYGMGVTEGPQPCGLSCALAYAMDVWKSTVIRLPMNQGFWMQMPS